MTSAIAILALVFLIALLLWANARRRLLNGGILEGRIVYQDTDRRRNVERPLVSHRYGLSGKPDYLVDRSNELIPVEVKSRGCALWAPRQRCCSDHGVLCPCGRLLRTVAVSPDYSIR